MKITLDLPESAFAALRRGPSELADELRLAACVKWYELGELSQAKAAEVCGLSRAEFIDVLGRFKVSAIQTDEDMLESEMSV